MVGDLKEAILEENKWGVKGIDAHRLSLWKVNISNDKDLQDEGHAFLERARAAGSRPLDPTWQIYKYFDSSYWKLTPKFGTIHVLVEIEDRARESLQLIPMQWLTKLCRPLFTYNLYVLAPAQSTIDPITRRPFRSNVFRFAFVLGLASCVIHSGPDPRFNFSKSLKGVDCKCWLFLNI